jgi:hypothetical protein
MSAAFTLQPLGRANLGAPSACVGLAKVRSDIVHARSLAVTVFC